MFGPGMVIDEKSMVIDEKDMVITEKQSTLKGAIQYAIKPTNTRGVFPRNF